MKDQTGIKTQPPESVVIKMLYQLSYMYKYVVPDDRQQSNQTA